MSDKNFANEIQKDQLWVYNEEFEKAIYDPDVEFPEVKPITQGKRSHWFGYYDKFQTDPADRFALSMEVGFDDRSPEPDDVIDIGMVDFDDNNRWIELGTSKAWCWQQGCALQWRPGSDDEIMWNDRQKDRFVCHILNVKTGERKTLPHAIYHVNPNGKVAVGIDYARVQLMRPGYGYAGIEDKNRDVLTPKDSCIYLLDLETGERKDVISVAQIAGIPYADSDHSDDKHYFDAALAWSPDGSRFNFLNRWRSDAKGRFKDFRTRMFTASCDGSDIRLVTDKPYISHFTWRDSGHIAMWREDGYKLFKDDRSGDEKLILSATNGHLSYLHDLNWMIADTYHDKNGYQNLFLFNIPDKKIMSIGRFFTPQRYRGGEKRCDLHPRLTRDGEHFIIDSTHNGIGRQMYMVDLVN